MSIAGKCVAGKVREGKSYVRFESMKSSKPQAAFFAERKSSPVQRKTKYSDEAIQNGALSSEVRVSAHKHDFVRCHLPIHVRVAELKAGDIRESPEKNTDDDE